MRRFGFLCCAVMVVACSKSDDQPAADTTAVAVAPAPLMASDLAGSWTVVTMPETSDSVLVTYQMTATADTSGWMVMLPNRPAMAARVWFGGDSVVMETGPYESVLRKGVQVSTHGVSRLQNGQLVGTTIARYTTRNADSVVMLRTRATRTP